MVNFILVNVIMKMSEQLIEILGQGMPFHNTGLSEAHQYPPPPMWWTEGVSHSGCWCSSELGFPGNLGIGMCIIMDGGASF